MTFSLRLTADLTLAWAARAFGASSSPILRVSSDENFESVLPLHFPKASSGENSLATSIASASESRSSIVWIVGTEPLDHPEAARFANEVAARGRHVFLETSGASLKCRLHEFKPSSRFHFVVRLLGQPARETDQKASDAAFRIGLEALRMARLAGFFTFAQLLIARKTNASEFEKLQREIRNLDVDGFLLTAALKSPELEKIAEDLGRRLPPSRSRLLSRWFAAAAGIPEASRSARQVEPLSLPQQQQPEDSFAESAEVQ